MQPVLSVPWELLEDKRVPDVHHMPGGVKTSLTSGRSRIGSGLNANVDVAGAQISFHRGQMSVLHMCLILN